MDAAAFGGPAHLREDDPQSFDITNDSSPDSRVPRSIARYLATARHDGPVLVLDPAIVGARYDALARGLGDTAIHYAVKACPEPAVLALLAARGSGFDAASVGEIELCRRAGADVAHISYGNTIKRARDIAAAHALGIDLFAVDSQEEVAKVARAAPGARVYCRLLLEESEADWPLSRKFGCPPEEAVRLSLLARDLGLAPVGLSFHVGSQARAPGMWRGALTTAAGCFAAAREAGLDFSLLNLGGGFPATYRDPAMEPEMYARSVMSLARLAFGEMPAHVMAEPGRGLVAEAGVIEAEVVMVARKRPTDRHRWVYLDIGKFGGLAETMEEAIRYRIETPRDDDPAGPCIIAGPTCDSADVLYETTPMDLPLTLRSGDTVRILSAGAYTTSYSSVSFNGFPPLETVCL